jgi:hypothetical protein
VDAQDWKDITAVLTAGAGEAGTDHGGDELSYVLSAMAAAAAAITSRHERELLAKFAPPGTPPLNLTHQNRN